MTPILVGITLMATGLALVWLANWLQFGLGEASKVALIVTPFFLFLILSGKISEFEGGGVKATFVSIAQGSTIQAANASSLGTPVVADVTSIGSLYTPCQPFYVYREGSLADFTSENTKETVRSIAISVRDSLLCGRFIAFVVLNQDDRPLGIVEAPAMLEILRVKILARNPRLAADGFKVVSDDAFSELITTEFGLLLTNPEFQVKSSLGSTIVVDAELTIKETYARMVQANVHVASIVDANGKFKGMITRDAIESWVMAQLFVGEVPKG